MTPLLSFSLANLPNPGRIEKDFKNNFLTSSEAGHGFFCLPCSQSAHQILLRCQSHTAHLSFPPFPHWLHLPNMIFKVLIEFLKKLSFLCVIISFTAFIFLRSTWIFLPAFWLLSTRGIISLFQGELFCLERIYSQIQIFLGKGADFKIVREKKYIVP